MPAALSIVAREPAPARIMYLNANVSRASSSLLTNVSTLMNVRTAPVNLLLYV